MNAERARSIWNTLQLGLGFWLIPFSPVAVVSGIAHSQHWVGWSIVLVILAITWPVGWFMWLIGDDYAGRS